MRSDDHELEQRLSANLRAAEEQWGPEDTHILSSLLSLVRFYTIHHCSNEAENLLLRALRICRVRSNGKAATAEMPDLEPTQTSTEILRELAVLYLGQLRLTEAEELLKQALAIGERLLEGEYDKVLLFAEQMVHRQSWLAATLSLLGRVYQLRGQYTQAEEFVLRAVHIYEQFYGPDHITLQGVLRQMETLCRLQGRHTDADAWQQRHKNQAWQRGTGRMVAEARQAKIAELEQSLQTLARSVLVQLVQARAQHLARLEPL